VYETKNETNRSPATLEEVGPEYLTSASEAASRVVIRSLHGGLNANESHKGR